MCARFTLKTRAAALIEAFELAESPQLWQPRYNIAPTQNVALLTNQPGPRRVQLARWGLIPSWAKDRKIGQRLINARSETVASKPSFRHSFRQQRCLILADGFYEWRHHGGGKATMYMTLHDGAPFAMAGLWASWRDPTLPSNAAAMVSCTVLTTTANTLVAPIHDRMPVILPRSAWSTWLSAHDPGLEALQPLLKPYAAAAMAATEVSGYVNAVRVDDPRCIAPLMRLL